MRIEEELKLDYSDVLFRPKRSTLSSRKEVDLHRTYKFKYMVRGPNPPYGATRKSPNPTRKAPARREPKRALRPGGTIGTPTRRPRGGRKRQRDGANECVGTCARRALGGADGGRK